MYIAEKTRYENMKYNRCGASGLKLPAVSLAYGTILVQMEILIP